MNDTGLDDPFSEATGKYLLVRNIYGYEVNQFYFFYF